MATYLDLMRAIEQGQVFKLAGDSAADRLAFDNELAILRQLEEDGLITIRPGRIAKNSMHASGGIRAVAPELTDAGRAWLDAHR